MPVILRCQPPYAAMFPSPETPSEPDPLRDTTGSTKVRGAVSGRMLQTLQPSGFALKPDWWKCKPPAVARLADVSALVSSALSTPGIIRPAPVTSADFFINWRRVDSPDLLIRFPQLSPASGHAGLPRRQKHQDANCYFESQ